MKDEYFLREEANQKCADEGHPYYGIHPEDTSKGTCWCGREEYYLFDNRESRPEPNDWMELQHYGYDDLTTRLREVYTALWKPCANEEGIEQEFWLHRVPYDEREYVAN